MKQSQNTKEFKKSHKQFRDMRKNAVKRNWQSI